MEITCYGAAGCVTGSCFLIDNGNKYLVDCGLFQGGRSMERLNREAWGFDPREIKALFLTHAHIDHSGRIPKLVRDGFKGKIFSTTATAELCRILLMDSAHIQEMEAEWRSRKSRRKGGKPVPPLYRTEDVEASFPLFQTVASDETLTLDERLRVRFRNAGHILGSSILEIWIEEGERRHKVVFSGDLGRRDQLIVKDPHAVFQADTLFIESTYGNRNHRSFEESKQELLEAIHYSYGYGEKVLIPAFAVERTQELLYVLGEFFRDGRIPRIPVFLDSPLAIAATGIFREMRSFYDEDTLKIVDGGHDPFDFPQLVLSRRTEDSIAINETPGPAIVIAGNGMCTAGRILHHLKHNLWRRGSSLVVVGYQAEGSVGRRIIEGAKKIRILGETVAVRARVFTIGGFSAHADQDELLSWISHFQNPRMQVVVIHGEQGVSRAFATVVRERFGFPVKTPAIGERVALMLADERAAVMEEREPDWYRAARRIALRAEAMKTLLREDAGMVSRDELEALREQLAEVENRLEALVEAAR